MSTFQIWMCWIIGLMVVLDAFCIVGYNKRKRENEEKEKNGPI